MLEFSAVSQRYGASTVLREVSFSLVAGERIVLLGANGSGKSTLLKIADGLIAPSAGQVRYKGEGISPLSLSEPTRNGYFRRQVGLLFQNPDAMLFNPTVLDEIAFGPRQIGLADADDRARRWARTVGVERHLERPPFGLSGGEKQKVCLAALLAMEPELLLLDEPAAALDPRSTGWLVDFLAGLKCAVVTSTHNLSLAPELGGRALVLGEDHGVVYDGPIEAFLADEARLLAANLMHIHRHRHGGVEHRHFHTHDWD